MTEPWNRNAGRFDRPSSGVPGPQPPRRLSVIGIEPEVERESLRGIEPIGSEEREVETVEPESAELPASALLRAFVHRLERMAEEIADLQADRRDVMKEATGAGFDGKALREILRRRKLDPAALESLDALVAVYEDALGTARRGEVDGGELRAQPRLMPPKSDRRGQAAIAALAAVEALQRAEQA